MQFEYDINRAEAQNFGPDAYGHYAMKDDAQMLGAIRQGNNHGIHQPQHHSSTTAQANHDTSSPSTMFDSDDQESGRGNFAGGDPKIMDLHDKKARHKLVEQNRREKKRVLCNQLQELVDPGSAPGAK
jgi:hypothetical protein